MQFKVHGEFHLEVWNEDWTELLHEETFPNGGCTAGFTDMLNTYFNAGTPITTWYLGLIDNVGFGGLSVSDTSAAHSGWTENTAYSATTRPQWTPSAPSGGSITNSSSVTFTMNNSAAIKGAFVISNNVKGGNSGILWATGLLSAIQNLVSGQNLKLTYTATLSALN